MAQPVAVGDSIVSRLSAIVSGALPSLANLEISASKQPFRATIIISNIREAIKVNEGSNLTRLTLYNLITAPEDVAEILNASANLKDLWYKKVSNAERTFTTISLSSLALKRDVLPSLSAVSASLHDIIYLAGIDEIYEHKGLPDDWKPARPLRRLNFLGGLTTTESPARLVRASSKLEATFVSFSLELFTRLGSRTEFTQVTHLNLFFLPSTRTARNVAEESADYVSRVKYSFLELAVK